MHTIDLSTYKRRAMTSSRWTNQSSQKIIHRLVLGHLSVKPYTLIGRLSKLQIMSLSVALSQQDMVKSIWSVSMAHSPMKTSHRLWRTSRAEWVHCTNGHFTWTMPQSILMPTWSLGAKTTIFQSLSMPSTVQTWWELSTSGVLPKPNIDKNWQRWLSMAAVLKIWGLWLGSFKGLQMMLPRNGPLLDGNISTMPNSFQHLRPIRLANHRSKVTIWRCYHPVSRTLKTPTCSPWTSETRTSCLWRPSLQLNSNKRNMSQRPRRKRMKTLTGSRTKRNTLSCSEKKKD